MTHETKPPIEISLPQNLYRTIDEKVNEVHGMGFAALAAEHPADAYSVINRVADVVADKPKSVVADGVKLTEKLDGQEAVTGAARQALERIKVDTDIEPIDVVVSVFGKPRFRDAIKGKKTKPVEVISFHVEPPNLAF
jgi:hypothetical protein